jgi:hypothetical protein
MTEPEKTSKEDFELPILMGSKYEELIGKGTFYVLENGETELRIRLNKNAQYVLDRFYNEYRPLSLSFTAIPLAPSKTEPQL